MRPVRWWKLQGDAREGGSCLRPLLHCVFLAPLRTCLRTSSVLARDGYMAATERANGRIITGGHERDDVSLKIAGRGELPSILERV